MHPKVKGRVGRENKGRNESLLGTPFYASFGEFKEGYNREEAEAGLHEGFRLRQRERRERYVNEMMLGSGLGDAAKKTLQIGVYQPQTALHVSNDVASVAGVMEPIAAAASEERDDQDSMEGNSPRNYALPPDTKLLETSPLSIMKHFGAVEVEVHSLKEVHCQLEENIKIAEETIDRGCSPFNFESLFESLSIALSVVEEGDAKVQITLPMQEEGAKPLNGAEAVMSYAREHITPLALTLVNTLYATEWMLQYTMDFVSSLLINNEEELLLRDTLLACCVRWLGKIDQFVAFSFALELMSESYDAFAALRSSSETCIGDLADSIEAEIKSILLLVFPKRRTELLNRNEGIKIRVLQLMHLLHNIEASWMPTVKFQREWKNEFLTRMYNKAHTVIAPGYLSASLGFIDESIYWFITGDSTVVHRSSVTNIQENHNNPLQIPAQRLTPETLVASLVEKRRVEEKLDFQQIGMVVKGLASYVVGLQLCMGTRFVLRQCGAEYDERWGFSMNYPPDAPDAVRDAVRNVSQLTDVLRKRVKERTDYQAGMLRHFFM